MSAAETLLSGPRGRRLCWTLVWNRMAGENPAPAWDRVWEATAVTGDLSGRVTELASCVALADPASMAAGEPALLAALGWVTDTAAYWGEPDTEDRALGHDAVREALLPIAEAITAAPGTRWWASPVALDSQRYAQFLDSHALPPPQLTGAAEMLVAWRAATVEDERSARDRPEDPSAPYSGHWWSAPALSGLPVTTRALPGLGAARLVLLEDSLGWRSARCWPLAPRDGARVYEVHGPDQWTELAGRYPLDVSRSRRHDWWRVTGRAGRWLIPDYAAVAADYDAVHLSVAGYLATAGRALPVGDASTMLAGWDPDATYWLTDVLSPAGPPTDWVADGGDGSCWRPAGEQDSARKDTQ